VSKIFVLPTDRRTTMLYTTVISTATPSSISVVNHTNGWEQDDDLMMQDDLSISSNEEASKVFELWQTESVPTSFAPHLVSPNSDSTNEAAATIIDADDFDLMDVVDDDQLYSNLLLQADDSDLLCPVGQLSSSSVMLQPLTHPSFQDIFQMKFDTAHDIDQFSLSLLTDDSGSDDGSSGGHSNNSLANSSSSATSPSSVDDEYDRHFGGQSFHFDERYKATLMKLAASMKRSQETRRSLTIETPETKKYTKTNKSLTFVLEKIEKSTIQLLKVHEEVTSPLLF
jgi:hypothetical protein